MESPHFLTVESTMSQSHKFVHQFDDHSATGELSIETNTAGGEHIRVELEEGGKVWLSANPAGWLHLARLCAELGMADYEPGYHFHKTFDFQASDGSGPEISLSVDESL
ncbi:MAG: hypothetical protein H0U79_05765 [Solirubrobacterales bacterium]|nr:hypothetical protein [Solirubrobacterales bacterium]